MFFSERQILFTLLVINRLRTGTPWFGVFESMSAYTLITNTKYSVCLKVAGKNSHNHSNDMIAFSKSQSGNS